jgi:hypothetical protein
MEPPPRKAKQHRLMGANAAKLGQEAMLGKAEDRAVKPDRAVLGRAEKADNKMPGRVALGRAEKADKMSGRAEIGKAAMPDRAALGREAMPGQAGAWS